VNDVHPTRSVTYRLCARAIESFAYLVPSSYRQRWIEEWNAELWHLSDHRRLELIRRSAGALRDALSTRILFRPERSRPPASSGEGKWNMLHRDIKFGARSLLKRPRFALLTVLTLAIGIGATTTIFSVVHAVLLKPLPYPEADRLLKVVGFKKDRGVPGNLSPADFYDIKEENHVFENMGAHGWVGFFTLTGQGDPERVAGSRVTVGFFPTLEVRPLLGRLFRADEDQPGAPPVAIISHGLWNRRFGSDPKIVGTTIGLNTVPTTIIGVLPPDYRHPEPNPEREPEVYALYGFERADLPRSGRFIRAIGRLEDGLTIENARVDLTTIADRLEQAYPETNTAEGLQVQPLEESIVSDSRPALLLLFAAVGFLLLIACANIANLLLAAGTERRKELAIRTALGAGRRQIISQLLSESLLLSLAGGSIGLLLASWGIRFLDSLGVGSMPRAGDLRVDGAVAVFTLGVAVVTALGFGLAPALQLSRADNRDELRDGSRSSGGPSVRGTRDLLVVLEVALSLVLLVGAALLLQSYQRLQNVPPGFELGQVVTLQVSLPTARYEEGEQIPFYRELYERLGSLPGVTEVGAINILPLSQNYSRDGFQINDRPVPPGKKPSAESRSVSPGYFHAMGIPLLRGRTFDERDTPDSPQVVVISDSMARRFWPNDDPIGKRITYNRAIPEERTREIGGPGSREIVGIVGDVSHLGLDEKPVPMFYTPQNQVPSFHTMTLVIRTQADPSALASGVRREVWAMDADIPVYAVQTLDTVVAKTVAAPRFRTWILGVFAGFALLLSLIGIYGVIGFLVRQRTHEIGIRVALGADKKTIRRMLVVQGMKPVALGLGIGLVSAAATSRLLSGLLYGVSATDSVTYVAVSLALALAALSAAWVPAERATRIDPVDVLRIE
jgi:putative ABC transport system permease protein